MSLRRRHACPSCGLKRDGTPFIEGICFKCFLEKKLTLDWRIEVRICRSCGRLRLSGEWVAGGRENLELAVANAVSFKLAKALRVYGAVVSTRLESPSAAAIRACIDEECYSWTQHIEIDLRRTLCEDCFKRLSGAHDAIVQVRGVGGPLSTREIRRIRELLASLPRELASSIVEVEEVRGGIDVKVLGHSNARSIASWVLSRLGGSSKETHKLAAPKGGRRRSKLTISLRVAS
ncbi:MAG: NMD3-related protein [Fervidicoccaceae archaeon]